VLSHHQLVFGKGVQTQGDGSIDEAPHQQQEDVRDAGKDGTGEEKRLSHRTAHALGPDTAAKYFGKI